MIKCKLCGCEFEDTFWNFPFAEYCYDCGLGLSKIPMAQRDWVFKNFVINDRNKRAVEKAREFVKPDNTKGLFLWGSVGSGKTHIAIAALVEIIKSKRKIQFTVVPELFIKIRDGFKNNNFQESDILNLYSKGILCLDDFGAEKITEFTIPTIYTLINYRYGNGEHKMIITSNLSLQQIAETMSDRIASRIAGMCEVAQIVDEDWRLK